MGLEEGAILLAPLFTIRELNAFGAMCIVCSNYHQLFYEMEALCVVDPDSEDDLSVLPLYVFPQD